MTAWSESKRRPRRPVAAHPSIHPVRSDRCPTGETLAQPVFIRRQCVELSFSLTCRGCSQQEQSAAFLPACQLANEVCRPSMFGTVSASRGQHHSPVPGEPYFNVMSQHSKATRSTRRTTHVWSVSNQRERRRVSGLPAYAEAFPPQLRLLLSPFPLNNYIFRSGSVILTYKGNTFRQIFQGGGVLLYELSLLSCARADHAQTGERADLTPLSFFFQSLLYNGNDTLEPPIGKLDS